MLRSDTFKPYLFSLLNPFNREIINTTNSEVFCLGSASLPRCRRQRIKLDFSM